MLYTSFYLIWEISQKENPFQSHFWTICYFLPFFKLKIFLYLKFIFYFFKYKFIYFNWRLITLQYCIGLISSFTFNHVENVVCHSALSSRLRLSSPRKECWLLIAESLPWNFPGQRKAQKAIWFHLYIIIHISFHFLSWSIVDLQCNHWFVSYVNQFVLHIH